MAKGKGKSGLIVTIVALGLTLVIVGTIAVLQNLNRPVTNDQSQEAPKSEESQTESPAEDTPATTEEELAANDQPSVDPATLTSVDIEPMNLQVFYSKGTPGFEFAIKRSADRTQYVEFSATKLVGTKCTDDEGIFATIIKNPATDENQSTVSQKTTIGSDTYGLSLAATTCTGNTDLLKTYQDAFSKGFSSLKAIEES